MCPLKYSGTIHTEPHAIHTIYPFNLLGIPSFVSARVLYYNGPIKHNFFIVDDLVVPFESFDFYGLLTTIEQCWKLLAVKTSFHDIRHSYMISRKSIELGSQYLMDGIYNRLWELQSRAMLMHLALCLTRDTIFINFLTLKYFMASIKNEFVEFISIYGSLNSLLLFLFNSSSFCDFLGHASELPWSA